MIRRTRENVAPELEDYAELLLQLHQRIAEGKGESDEADALRDHMDVYWNSLDEGQLAIARQLSADLYTIYDASGSGHPRNKDLYSPELAAEVARAHQSQNFLEVLKLLGRRSTEISHDRATVLRGIGYRELGLVQAGLRFMWSAAKDSQHPETAYVAILNTLWHYVDVNAAAVQAIDLLRNKTVQGAPLTFLVGCLLLTAAANQQGIVRTEYAEASRNVFADLLSKTPYNESSVNEAQLQEFLGQCYSLLEQTPQAITHFSNAIQRSPADGSLYVQRGLLILDRDFALAKSDFAKAIEHGTFSVWPYYYLAFDAFRCGDYARSEQLAKEAITKDADLELYGMLHELVAMSLASGRASLSHSDIASIRHHFRTAMTLSPVDQEILANHDVFEDALQKAILEHGWVLRRPVTSMNATSMAINRRLHLLAACD